MNAYSTSMRMQQHRPDLTAEMDVPATVLAQLRDGLSPIFAAADAAASHSPRAAAAVRREVEAIHAAITPEQRVRCVSQITGVLREGAFMTRRDAPECVALLQTLATHFIFPIILHCAVRYLHRALATLLRTVYVVDATLEAQFQRAFLAAYLDPWRCGSSGRPALFNEAENGKDLLQHKDAVMLWVNCVDSTMVVAAPLFSNVFAKTFLDVLPLLGDALRWMVANAQVGTNQTSVDDIGGETLLGEDLSYVRYGIRVVTTYAHKFLSVLRDALSDLSVRERTMEDLSRLITPALAMLSSPAFPKDVLNAAGLLVSSLLTLCFCEDRFLFDVCHRCAAPLLQKSGNFHTCSLKKECTTVMCPTGQQVMDLVKLVCNIMKPNRERSAVLHAALDPLTDNGRFALMKGLLAHLSGPIYGDVDTLGVLLRPVTAALSANDCVEKPDDENLVTVHDVVMPAAQAYSGALHAPDTRFMAIQTVDAVVRHISAVLACVADLTLPPDEFGNSKAVKSLRKSGVTGELKDIQRLTLAQLCVVTPKLTATLRVATDMLMGMWDDGTQQVAGPLYDTYSEILSVQVALRRCAPLLNKYTLTTSTEENDFDAVNTLQRVLFIPNERRGKYHALLGLLGVIPFEQFLAGLVKHYNAPNEANALAALSRCLIAGAGNHKIGNIAGEVFAKTSAKVREVTGSNHNEKDDSLMQFGIFEPLALSLVLDGYTSSLPGMSVAQSISNIIAHIVTPCLRGDAHFLEDLLSVLAKISTANTGRSRQSIVELLYRARAAGRDVSSQLRPGCEPFRAVLHALQAQEVDLRYAALELCVVRPRKAERVEVWQCRMMEWFVSTNMHVGGDSTALRHFLEVLKKWCRRLLDSYAQQDSIQRRVATDSVEFNEAEAYKLLVMEHCLRTVSAVQPHIGESVELCSKLSIERRVAALSVHTSILETSVSMFPPTSILEAREGLFPLSLVEGLLDCLSAGWERARSAAHTLLLLYCRHAPELLFGSADKGDGLIGDAKRRRTEALRAQTYRHAQGAVLRYVLAVDWTPLAQRDAARNPMVELKRRLCSSVAEISELRATLGNFNKDDEEHHDDAVLALVEQRPLHGAVSLCAELLASACEVQHHGNSKNNTRIKNNENPNNIHDDTGAVNEIARVCEEMLLCCCDALHACGGLVGGAAVDCRGHLLGRRNDDNGNAAEDGKGDSSESVMRAVVNRTWLTIRASAAAVRSVLRLMPIESLPIGTLRTVCKALVDCLLRTKHNGVMRAVREALSAVAAALLRARGSSFHRLPSDVLDGLMGPDGVACGSVVRMLRRSQGLPHALLAILEAEDPAVPAVLFPRAMRQLLHISATGKLESTETTAQGKENLDDGYDEAIRCRRSNALNVLKFVFENKSFASRSVAYIEEAFWIATDCFDDPNWGIRNSALMLFASVLPRFVGEHPSSGGVGANTSLRDIAVRAPRAVAFAHDELLRSGKSAVPSLGAFPLLQMLSMLAPDPPHMRTHATVGANGEDDAARLSRAVQLCGTSRNLMIRAASAAAMVALVPFYRLKEVLSMVTSTFSRSQVEMNALHGALLHARAFHATYVGTLHVEGRPRTSHSGATMANKCIVGGTIMTSIVSASIPLRHACAPCPTVAIAFLYLAADVLHYALSSLSSSQAPSTLSTEKGLYASESDCVALASLGVDLTHDVFCCTGAITDSTLHSAAALFSLAVVRLQHFLGSGKVSEPLRSLSTRLASLLARDSLVVCAMEHLSTLTETGRCTAAESASMIETLEKISTCDFTCTAWRLLEKSVNLEITSQSCTDIYVMEAQLRFLVELGHTKCDTLHKNTVESHLLQRLEPQSTTPLCNSAVRSWAIRLLARSYTGGVTFLRVLSYYAQPDFHISNRSAVVDALRLILQRQFLLKMKKNTGNTLDKVEEEEEEKENGEAFGILLIILLRLLLDDAYEVRMDACRLVSDLLEGNRQGGLWLDHMTCVISTICSLRRCFTEGLLNVDTLRHHLCMDSETLNMDTRETEREADGTLEAEPEEDEESDGGVLFEKEAENMFAEEALLEYFVGSVAHCKAANGADMKVYDDLISQAERVGSAALLYEALFDGTSRFN